MPNLSMNKAAKTQALLASLLIALSCISLPLICAANAQTTSNPSKPEFTVQLTDRSYDTPDTYSIDSYTGKNITHIGSHVTNKTLDITITNQPFSKYTDRNGNTTNLYYIVRARGHFGGDWKYYPHEPASQTYSYQTSNTAYTYVSLLTNTDQYSDDFDTVYTPNDSQIDIQIQALIGYYHKEWVSYDTPSQNMLLGGIYPIFYGQKSNWSDTYTISIPEGNVTITANTDIISTETQTQEPTQTPDITATPAPSVPEFSVIAIVPLFVIVLMAALLVKSKARLLG
jgi:hypothetical protein